MTAQRLGSLPPGGGTQVNVLAPGLADLDLVVVIHTYLIHTYMIHTYFQIHTNFKDKEYIFAKKEFLQVHIVFFFKDTYFP